MSKPKLTYFSSRGLIEPLRLLLADAGVEYERNDVGSFSAGNPPAAFLSIRESGVCLLLLLFVSFYFLFYIVIYFLFFFVYFIFHLFNSIIFLF